VHSLSDLKVSYTIAAAWRDLNLPGAPGKCVASPFREDRSPSFSVFADGTKAKDFATGESFDVFDFVVKARGCNTAEAIRWVQDRVGIGREPQRPTRLKPGAKLPPQRWGTEAELRELSERRGFSAAALRLAEQRGFLRFTTLWGLASWCLTDKRCALHEFRRLDGAKWPAYGRLPARKCHCYGTGKAWPIGTLESGPFATVAWVEGAPDFLAAIHFILLEGKEQRVAPVGVLGAANHALAPDALAKFAGKHVCLYPHADEAGRKAAREWARQLKEVGAARVTAFELSKLVLVDGTEGKDLADVCRISADCFEREGKFQEVMP
jgi:hypothetical protein